MRKLLAYLLIALALTALGLIRTHGQMATSRFRPGAAKTPTVRTRPTPTRKDDGRRGRRTHGADATLGSAR